MSESTINYGPLKELIGVWKGDRGTDIAPDPDDGTEVNPYYETITFTEGGDLKNASRQTLSVVHYRQIVRRKSDDGIFHDQTGYWLWDEANQVIIQSIVIPRAVCVLAGADYVEKRDDAGNLIIEVAAALDDKDWGIIQSPFMRDNANTTSFQHKIVVGNGKMVYSESTLLDIYGNEFEHTDDNTLLLQ